MGNIFNYLQENLFTCNLDNLNINFKKWKEILSSSNRAKTKKQQKKPGDETSLVVQWLRMCLAMQRTQVQSLVWELRSHMLWGN